MTQSIVPLLSPTGFISWMLILALIAIVISLILTHKKELKAKQGRIELLQNDLADSRMKLQKLEELEQMIPELQKIARLDHDVNTPLCVITMSLGRAKKLGQQSGDELLLNNVKDITDAVARIGEIMQAVRVLKTHPLVVQNKAHTSTKEIGQ